MRALPLPLALVALLALPASAGDWYVDPVNGSDGNSGSAPGQAWRTVSFALTQVPVGAPETIHLAPGTYSPATGETYPWDVRPRFALVGDAGAAATVVQGDGSWPVVAFRSLQSANPWDLPEGTGLRGATLRGSFTGVLVHSDAGRVAPALEDLVIEGMSGAGLAILTQGQGAASVEATLRRVELRGNAVGIDLEARAQGVALRLEDCAVLDGSWWGIDLRAHTRAAVVLERCRLQDNANVGLSFASGAGGNGWLQLAVRDTLITGNPGGVFGAAPAAAGDRPAALLERCTVGANGVGVQAAGAAAGPPAIALRGSIVAGNGDDLVYAAPAQLAVAFTCIGDGDFAGQNGNFQADPGFVDPASGDWRLAWGSPCVEAGEPDTPVGVPDLAGYLRPIDGDLDAVERADCGAFEFAPLFAGGPVQIGRPLELELWGPAGASATLHFARALPVASPLATPFGDFDLERTLAFPVALLAAAPGPPALLRRQIPFDPSLVGLGFSFQALVSSPAAPAGFAFSNALAVVPGF